MSLETATKVAKDSVDKSARIVEAGIKKAWSILDAAIEKKRPGEFLSQSALRAVQGEMLSEQ